VKVFAISDPHLSSGTPGKSMDVFGPEWAGHPGVMAERWRAAVSEGDIVLVAGDISWAMRLDAALPDLEFLAALPGRKILIRGNHDYWWSSASKVRAVLPEGMFIIQNDAVNLDGISVAGSRLWDDPLIRCGELAVREPGKTAGIEMAPLKPPAENEKIFVRELGRLGMSLAALDRSARLRIVMVHFPPLSPTLEESRASVLIEQSGASFCVFGHLHALIPAHENPLYGTRNGVTYSLTSCDYIDFSPVELAEV